MSEGEKVGSRNAFKTTSFDNFVAGATARTAADLVGVNRHTATLYFHKLRELIALRLAETEPWLSGEIEVDESYFGGSRKGKRGRGAAGKVPVFGLLKAERCMSSSFRMPNKIP